MKRSDLLTVCEKLYSKNSFRSTVNMLLLGYHGVSKTQFVDEVGSLLGLPVVTVIGSQIEPTDLTGLPSLVDGKAVYARPTTLLDVPQILFLDEINSCPPDVRFSMFSLLCSHKVGQHKLVEGSIVIGAGNPENSVYDVAEIQNEAFWDRLLLVDFEPDYGSFAEHLQNTNCPDWALKCLNSEYFRYATLPAIELPLQKPSFRSFEVSVRMADYLLKNGVGTSIVEELVSGYCGREVAVSLISSYEQYGKQEQLDPYTKVVNGLQTLHLMTSEERKEMEKEFLSLDPELISKFEMDVLLTPEQIKPLCPTVIYKDCPTIVAKLIYAHFPFGATWEEHLKFFTENDPKTGEPNNINLW